LALMVWRRFAGRSRRWSPPAARDRRRPSRGARAAPALARAAAAGRCRAPAGGPPPTRRARRTALHGHPITPQPAGAGRPVATRADGDAPPTALRGLDRDSLSHGAPRGALGGGVRGRSVPRRRLSLLRERRACRILIAHCATRRRSHRRPHAQMVAARAAHRGFGPRGWRNLVSESSAPYRHELSAARSQALRHALNERVHSESHVRLTSVRPKISQGSEISLPLRLSASSTSLKSSAELRSASNES
jgi:hypothetical protein